MSNRSRRKGADGEREIVALARAAGLRAERTWQTAQSADETERRCDVLIEGRPAQVKVAADGFKSLYDTLDGVQMAFLRSDRREWLVVLRAEDYLKLLAASKSSGDAGSAAGRNPGSQVDHSWSGRHDANRPRRLNRRSDEILGASPDSQESASST